MKSCEFSLLARGILWNRIFVRQKIFKILSRLDLF
jgi:hypothetical protein